MKRSTFSEAQVAFVLRQAEEGTKVEEVCRRAGGHQSGHDLRVEEEVRWPDAVGDEAPPSVRGGNGRLKRIVADLLLDKEMLQDVIKRKL